MMMMIDTSWRHEKKKRGVIRKTTIRQVRICRYVIPYLRSRFVGCIFIKGNGRGEERITLFVHISIHTHITTSPRSSNYGWAFRFFCFPTLSRVPHLERAGNKKRKRRMSSTDLEIPWKNYSMQERLHILQVLQRDVQLRRDEFERIRSVCSLLSNQKVVFFFNVNTWPSECGKRNEVT